MALNNPRAPASVRQPRLQVLHDGQPIGGALSFEAEHNAYYQAATFRCTFAFNADPAHGLAFWSDTGSPENPLLLDIQASLDGGQTYTSLILGQVDRMRAHVELGLIELEGRDRSAALIDSRTSETFLNKTASQVVEILASRHGLQADTTETNELVGRFYEQDHERIGASAYTRTATEWDLLASFAQKEQYDLWVTGDVLHFHPHAAVNPDPYVVLWDGDTPFSNAMEITADRSLTFAKDLSVEVRSWHSRDGKAYAAYVGQSDAPPGRTFRYVIPNLSKSECLDMANQIRDDLSRHERVLSFSTPADLTLTARNLVQLNGAGAWDATSYKIDSLRRELSWDGGFLQRIQAKSFIQNANS